MRLRGSLVAYSIVYLRFRIATTSVANLFGSPIFFSAFLPLKESMEAGVGVPLRKAAEGKRGSDLRAVVRAAVSPAVGEVRTYYAANRWRNDRIAP